jgi:glycosyltransferase involved in cell wall biosynthesis
VKFLFLSTFAHLALDPGDPKVSGGAELQVALLSKELVQRGNEVTIIGCDAGQTSDRILEGVRCRKAGRFQTGRLADTLQSIGPVFSIIRDEHPDYIFVLGWTAWLAMLLAARPVVGARIGYICGLDTEVNGQFRRENPLRGAIFEFGVRHSDLRFAMSEYQRREFHRAGLRCGFYRNLVRDRGPENKSARDIDFFWVARGQPVKRPHLFLDLAAHFPTHRCVMVCPKQDDAALWDSIATRAAGMANVTFSDGVPYHRIQSYYDRARIFVSTSEAEGFPNTFIQAAAGGAAIVSLNVDPDGVLEQYAIGKCAATPEELFEFAKELIEEPEKLGVHGRNGMQFFRRYFDNRRNVEAFLDGLENQT